MNHRHFEDVDFEYDTTDPTVVRDRKSAIMAAQPLAYNFQIDGWRSHEDKPGGYFRISWELRDL
ncbi:hypothetical protein [Nocardia cerradoensis]|uniref:Uncharacterized protein n=1 Tax=Nocardia cerradoensis TaxID=85688 RepID=A0A231GT55_9NOCA|nr:hypothetical protein [Nocardia cerradoensis]NKY47989.1 hypothetical protein [Nocardia cerradoensis]OXR39725.1 hypothetical protein B7C42_08204 [Nocardia cerradoensis]